jgi:hypothetical protein
LVIGSSQPRTEEHFNTFINLLKKKLSLEWTWGILIS